MPSIPPIDPCLDCRPESSNIASLLGIVNNSLGSSASTQLFVTVAGANVAVLPAASYQSILIQNTGDAPVFIRTGTGASVTGANGEIVLHAATAFNAGNGGSVTIENYIGAITAACATSSSISVTSA